MSSQLRNISIVILFCTQVFASSDHHDEGSAAVGPDKGITEKSGKGFKLSPEAVKTMEISYVPYLGKALTLPRHSLALIKTDKYLFRFREGWHKRVEVKIISQSDESITVTSPDLIEDDQVVKDGTGFLRVVEVFASEGAKHAH